MRPQGGGHSPVSRLSAYAPAPGSSRTTTTTSQDGDGNTTTVSTEERQVFRTTSNTNAPIIERSVSSSQDTTVPHACFSHRTLMLVALCRTRQGQVQSRGWVVQCPGQIQPGRLGRLTQALLLPGCGRSWVQCLQEFLTPTREVE